MRCFALPTFFFASFCKSGQLSRDLLLNCSRFLYLVSRTQEMDWHFVLQCKNWTILQGGTVPTNQLWPFQVVYSRDAHSRRAFQDWQRWFYPFSIEANGVALHLALHEEKGTLSQTGTFIISDTTRRDHPQLCKHKALSCEKCNRLDQPQNTLANRRKRKRSSATQLLNITPSKGTQQCTGSHRDGANFPCSSWQAALGNDRMDRKLYFQTVIKKPM